MFKKMLYFSFAVFMILFMWSVNASIKAFEERASFREVYLYKNSSESVIKEYKGLEFFVKGESIKIGDVESLENILNYYKAKVVFIEETEEGTSYYAFSEKAKYKQRINGYVINLHIFIGKDRTVIGSPIIYGSF